jgi:subtilisin
MTDDRIWKIPPDFKRDYLPKIQIQNSQPWHIPISEFRPIWDMGIDGRGINICISDTGYNNHPDLPRPIAIRNFTNDRNVNDDNGHGVHCAGTAVGRNGISPAPGANLIVAKVMNSKGEGQTNWINAGREWAAQVGADIISESIGGAVGSNGDIDSLKRTYENGAKACIAAAGNSGSRGGNSVEYPARYRETCCVGAYDRNFRITTFSSSGREMDVAAPGHNIISASHRGGRVSNSGTSMACPYIAAIFALIIQKRRIGGYQDIKTMDGWRQFFRTEGFFKDIDVPGIDHKSGLGAPLIRNILSWLKEPISI